MLHESHSVETPEQTNIEFTVAGIGSRAIALALDTLIQTGVLLVVLIAGLVGSGVMANVSQAAVMWFTAVLVIAAFLLYYGYFAVFEIIWNGQTPGKRKVHIRVIKDSGRRLTPLETIARNLLRIVDQIPGFYALGMMVSLLNRQNKRIGDLVVGALVVREAPASEANPLWFVDVTQPPQHAPIGAERLTDDELILIESFLQRRYELDPAIRSRMATEIFRRVESNLTFSPEERPAVEHLLEAAARERRGGFR